MKTIDDEFIRKNRHIFRHKKCVFIVGAGISVASGIPDFRSPNGIFSLLRQQLRIDGRQLFSYNFGIREGTREIYLKYIADLKKLCDSSQPNAVHQFLAAYPSSRVYTQNIDGLEERAGMLFNKSDKTHGVYLHGNLKILQCRYCGYKESFREDAVEEYSKGEDRSCSLCLERREKCIKNGIRKRPIGVMHPGIIHYQQAHPDSAFIGRMTEKDEDCDLLIVIGTSLKVEGIKKMVKMFAKYPGVVGKRILVNLTQPTKEWEQVFDYFYEGDCCDFVAVNSEGMVDGNKGDLKKAKEFVTLKEKKETSVNITDNSLNLKIDKEIIAEQVIVDKEIIAEQVIVDKEIIAEQKVATAKISLNLRKTSLTSACAEKTCESYLSEEKYDDSLLKMKTNTEKTPLQEKLEALVDAFDKEDAIKLPVLNRIISSTTAPTVILQPETCSATEFIQNLPDSSCADLEEEFNKTFSESFIDESPGQAKESTAAVTPKKKTKQNSFKN